MSHKPVDRCSLKSYGTFWKKARTVSDNLLVRVCKTCLWLKKQNKTKHIFFHSKATGSTTDTYSCGADVHIEDNFTPARNKQQEVMCTWQPFRLTSQRKWPGMFLNDVPLWRAVPDNCPLTDVFTRSSLSFGLGFYCNYLFPCNVNTAFKGDADKLDEHVVCVFPHGSNWHGDITVMTPWLRGKHTHTHPHLPIH